MSLGITLVKCDIQLINNIILGELPHNGATESFAAGSSPPSSGAAAALNLP